MKFYFPAPLNIHKLCDGKNLVVRSVLPQFLADGAQTSCAYGPLHVDSESFCLEQPVLNVEDAVINFLTQAEVSVKCEKSRKFPTATSHSKFNFFFRKPIEKQR